MRRVHLVLLAAALVVAANLGTGSPAIAAAATGPHLLAVTVTPSVVHARAIVTKQLQALGTYDDGSQQDITSQVTWSSSNPAAASVTNSGGRGLVTTLSSGTTLITAAASSGPSGASSVVVGAQLVALRLSPDSAMLRGGTGRSLHGVGTFSDGSRANLRKELQWSSSDGTIALFSTDKTKVAFVVAANKAGSTTITAAAPSSTPDTALRATGQITVNALLTSFKLLPKTISTRAKKTARQHIKALATYSDGASSIDITQFVTFASSDPTIAVAKNRPGKGGGGLGVVTGARAGTAEITARSATTGVEGSNPVTVHVR